MVSFNLLFIHYFDLNCISIVFFFLSLTFSLFISSSISLSFPFPLSLSLSHTLYYPISASVSLYQFQSLFLSLYLSFSLFFPFLSFSLSTLALQFTYFVLLHLLYCISFILFVAEFRILKIRILKYGENVDTPYVKSI